LEGAVPERPGHRVAPASLAARSAAAMSSRAFLEFVWELPVWVSKFFCPTILSGNPKSCPTSHMPAIILGSPVEMLYIDTNSHFSPATQMVLWMTNGKHGSRSCIVPTSK
jgi:hypothetical protein